MFIPYELAMSHTITKPSSKSLDAFEAIAFDQVDGILQCMTEPFNDACTGGGQFDLVLSPARAMHHTPMWALGTCGEPNEIKGTAHIRCLTLPPTCFV